MRHIQGRHAFGRRELLAGAGLAAVTAAVAACSSDTANVAETVAETATTPERPAPTAATTPATAAPPVTTTMATTTTATPAAVPVPVRRPHPNLFLSGNYAPVTTETTATDLVVEGRLPGALSGHFVRNGPNPIVAPSGPYHWFGGDGMVHIVELDAGKARSYRNRWIRTPGVAAALGEAPPDGPVSSNGIDISNTSTARLGDTLLSLTEGALPYRFAADGTTLGRTDLDGALTHGLSAHAKYDPTTGEVHQVSYRALGAPFAVWQVIDSNGRVTSTTPLDLPQSVMIHNVTLTPKHVLVYDLPVAFSTAALGAGWSVPYAWDPAHQARLGVIDRATASVRWIALPPQFVFHDATSHDTELGLQVDLVAYPKVFDGDLSGPDLAGARLERWNVDLQRGSVDQQVLDDRPQEFPRAAPGLFGQAARFTYTIATGTRAELVSATPGGGVLELGNVVVRHDRQTGSTSSWSEGPARSFGEAVFVADPERSAAEDGGWLLAFRYDAVDDASDVVVLDAADVASGPIASVRLPQRVPMGFHGNWYERR